MSIDTFELLEPVSADEERERLRPIISEARRVQAPEYPNACTDDEVIDAILAAGFRRA